MRFNLIPRRGVSRPGNQVEAHEPFFGAATGKQCP